VSSALGGSVERESKSWFAVLSFCATVAMVAAFALAILVASATIAFALANRLESPAPEKQVVVVTAESSPATVSEELNRKIQRLPALTTKTPRPRRTR